MKTMNRFYILGRLVSAPRFLEKNGNRMAFVTIADNTFYQGNDGEWVKRASFFDVGFFGSLAERLQGLKAEKGMVVFVEGSMQTVREEGEDGPTRSIRLTAHDFSILGGGSSSDAEDQPGNGSGENIVAGQAQEPVEQRNQETNGEFDFLM